MDLLYLIDNALAALVYLGLYELLKDKHRAVMQIARWDISAALVWQAAF